MMKLSMVKPASETLNRVILIRFVSWSLFTYHISWRHSWWIHFWHPSFWKCSLENWIALRSCFFTGFFCCHKGSSASNRIRIRAAYCASANAAAVFFCSRNKKKYISKTGFSHTLKRCAVVLLFHWFIVLKRCFSRQKDGFKLTFSNKCRSNTLLIWALFLNRSKNTFINSASNIFTKVIEILPKYFILEKYSKISD